MVLPATLHLAATAPTVLLGCVCERSANSQVRAFGLQGNVYRPNVVRIGSEEAPVSARAKDVWVDGLIAHYMDMDITTWTHRSSPCPNIVSFVTCIARV